MNCSYSQDQADGCHTSLICPSTGAQQVCSTVNHSQFPENLPTSFNQLCIPTKQNMFLENSSSDNLQQICNSTKEYFKEVIPPTLVHQHFIANNDHVSNEEEAKLLQTKSLSLENNGHVTNTKPPTSKTEKKRKDLSIKEKLDILYRYDQLPKLSQRNAAAKLQISQPLLCKILKHRTEIERKMIENENLSFKRKRSGKDKQVEAALTIWWKSVCEQDTKISARLIRQKAEQLASQMGRNNFVANDGWFNRWKKRENIEYKQTRGKQNKESDFTKAEHWIKNEWLKIITQHPTENIYNADETALFYKALPEHAYMFRSDKCKGFKSAKERVTVLCCVSMLGEKKKLLVIGKTKNPKCFSGVKRLPADYYSNSNACMTSMIFNEWLVRWDSELKKDIVLLVDNCPTHIVEVALKHIQLVYLPSLIQPCEKGIIRTLKEFYRREMRTRVLENIQDSHSQNLRANEVAEKTNLLEALHLLGMSWAQITDRSIRSCFKRGGFSGGTNEEELNGPGDDNKQGIIMEPLADLSINEFEMWMGIDENIKVSLLEADVEPEDESNINDINETPPSNAEMREALRVLRRGVQHRSSEFHKHYEYETFITGLLRNGPQL